MLFCIAGLWIYINGDNPYFEERCASFRRELSEKKPEECDMYVDLKSCSSLEKPEGTVVERANNSAIMRKIPPLEGFFIYALFPEYINSVEMPGGNVSVIDADPSWSHIKYRYVRDDSRVFTNEVGKTIKWTQHNSFLTLGLPFRYMLIKKNGIQIHCSSIDYNGQGIIFSAPSGTGKSTHVRLWQELYGDALTVINDDRPTIRYIDNAPMVCGTPWSGTSDNFNNRIVPLNTIVILEQAPENTIERLSGTTMLQRLMPRCFLPYFDASLMAEALNTLERLVNDVPVFLLKCRPDYEAVELVRKCLR